MDVIKILHENTLSDFVQPCLSLLTLKNRLEARLLGFTTADSPLTGDDDTREWEWF